MNRNCGFAAGSHGEDHGGAAGDNVAAGKYTALGPVAGSGLGHNVVPLVRLQFRRSALDQRICGGADADDHHVSGQNILGADNGNRPSASVRVGFAQFHAHATRASEPALLVADKFDGVGQHAEFDTFFNRMMNLFEARGHLGLGAAIDQRCRARTKPARSADCVHGGVAAAHNDHVAIAAIVYRLIVLGDLVGTHQVDACEKFVGGVDAVEVLAGNVKKHRQPCAGSHKDSVELFVPHQLINGYALADHDVGFKLHAHPAQVVHFTFDNRLGQAELRNPVNKNAAKFVQRLEDAHPVALLNQIARSRKTGRAATHDGHAFAGGRGDGGQAELAAIALVVSDEALQVTNGDRRALLAEHASALALIFLRTNAAGDGGQRVILAHFGRGGQIVACTNESYDVFDLYAYRTLNNAAGLGALDAARRFSERICRGQAQIHFFKIAAAHLGIGLRHVRAQNSHPLFQRKYVAHAGGKLPAVRHNASPLQIGR